MNNNACVRVNKYKGMCAVLCVIVCVCACMCIACMNNQTIGSPSVLTSTSIDIRRCFKSVLNTSRTDGPEKEEIELMNNVKNKTAKG